MGLSLLLLLLLLLLSLLTFLRGASSKSCSTSDYWVKQPKHLYAFEGRSIYINFSFYYPWKLADNPNVNISLRWKDFHGKGIYNQTGNFTHEEFKDRLTLERTEGKNEGVFFIRGLRREDATTYFCQVQLRTQNCGDQKFQSIEGTNLTITPASSESCPTSGFGVNQPRHLQAFEGSSIRINFSFKYPWKLAKYPYVKIFLRWKHFDGDIIYKQNGNFIFEEFKDRLTLERTEGKNEGVFLIRGLRREDATTYFCRVQLRTQNCGNQEIQSIEGTNLTITPAHHTGFLGSADMFPVTLVIFLFKITILGLITYLVWKRSQAGFKGAASLSGGSPVNQSTNKRGGHSSSENPVPTNL